MTDHADTHNAEALYRGKALFVAEFLSTFQAFFRRNDAERKGPVSVQMIEQALGYRQQLLRHYDLENKLVVLRKDGTLTEEELKECQDKVAASKAKIESSSATDKSVHELLRRFEVWSTKALANQVLTHCVKADNPRNKSICCSPVLNVPGVSHFLLHLSSSQEAGNETNTAETRDVSALGIPPNAWTWKEYLRICNMISLLEKPEDVMKSTLTAASPILIGTRKEELKLSEKDNLSLADLAALWVRSQRNTSALLHLMHLFKVKEAPPEEPEQERYTIRASDQYRGKQVVVTRENDHEQAGEQAPDKEEAEPRYAVEYVGNHKKTRSHVLHFSRRLDELIEWAVTNQALFTYRYIRQGIPQRLGLEKAHKKRPAPANDQDGITSEAIPAKRRRTMPCQNEEKLLQACQCYVLRWFARRNRKVASILFTSKLKHIPLFPFEDLVDYLIEQDIPDKVKIDLRETCGSQDRTLARIDRRNLLSKYHNESQHECERFEGIIVLLLRSLANCAPPERLTQSEVLATCEDFECLCNTFLRGKSATEAADLLLDWRADLNTDPAEVLGSFNAPWHDRCLSCEQALGGEDSPTIECNSCMQRFHQKCFRGACDVRPMSELAKEYGPLAQFYETLPEDFKSECAQVRRCSWCKTMIKNEQTSENYVLFAEAVWCKALIRDIGMESYSLPFHDESPPKVDDNQEGCPDVSLRRLDAMMQYICVENDPSMSEAERLKQLKVVGNPFHRPPWNLRSSERPLQVKWITEEMKQHPMQLLCKGVELMMRPLDTESPSWMEERIAFSHRFIFQFSTWFLCRGELQLSMQPSGRLSHVLHARPPWTQSSCLVCRACPASSTIETASSVCDNAFCQKRHSRYISSSGEVRPAASGRPSTCPTPTMGANGFADTYDELSSLVGSILLVLPGDPMLEFVSKELNNLSIAHEDRPMFFFVASYLPRLFSKSEYLSSSIDDEGIFHVLPVLTVSQLKYLLSLRAMRRAPEDYAESDDWTNLAILNLEGVIRMNATELRRKLKETTSIREAIDSTIGRALGSAPATSPAAACCGKGPLVGGSMRDRAPSFCATVSEYSHEMMYNYSSLIDCLLRSKTPLVRDIIGLLRPSEVDDDLPEDNGVLCDVQASEEAKGDHDDYDAEMEELHDGCSRGQDVQHKNSVVGGVNPADMLSALDEDSEMVLAPTANDDLEPVAHVPPTQGRHTANDGQGPGAYDQQQPANHLALSLRGQPPDGHAMVNRNRTIETSQGQQADQQVLCPQRQPPYNVVPSAQGGGIGSGHSCDPTSIGGQSLDGRFISGEDLNIPAKVRGTILTQVEAAILAEALSRNLPNLGIRLLCPRYSIDVARQQLRFIVQGDCSQLPRVQDKFWQGIVKIDYRRSKLETGAFILSDSPSADENYHYRLPVKPMPLDRGAEHYLAAEQSILGRQPQLGSAAQRGSSTSMFIDLTGDELFPERIRGGGPSGESFFVAQHGAGDEQDEDVAQAGDAEGQAAAPPNAHEEGDSDMEDGAEEEILNAPTVLADAPRETWQNTLVHIRVATTFYGENREEATTIGVVQMDPQIDEIDRVRVALFHFSNVGYLPEPTTRFFTVSQCFVVREGSREANVARQWDGLAELIGSHPIYVSDDQTDEDRSVGGVDALPPDGPREEANCRASSQQSDNAQKELDESTSVANRQSEISPGSSGDTEPPSISSQGTLANTKNAAAEGQCEGLNQTTKANESPQSCTNETESEKKAHADAMHETSAANQTASRPCSSDEQSDDAVLAESPNEPQTVERQRDDLKQPATHSKATDSPQSRTNETAREDGAQGDAIHETCTTSETDNCLSPSDDLPGRTRAVLAELPKDSWKNAFVFSEVKTSRQAESTVLEQATVIGVVQKVSNAEHQDEDMEDDEVAVDLFYISNVGYLPGSVLQELPATQLYIVQAGSDESRIAMEWSGYEQWKTLSESNHAEESDAIGKGEKLSAFEPRGIAGSGEAQARIDGRFSDGTISIRDSGMRLVGQICQSLQGPAPLGKLPDSRALVWVQSDPNALYVRMNPKHGSDGRNSAACSGFRCPWGCSCEPRDVPLLFATQETLDDHIRVRHDFGKLYANFQEGGHLYRIPEGRPILALAAQLASTICSKCPNLTVLMERLSSGTRTFPPTAVLDLSSQGGGVPKQVIAGISLSSTDAYCLLLLWSKITRLFAIESTGLFRFDADACETLLYFGSQESPTRVLETSDHGSTACLDVARSMVSSGESKNCNLCGSRGDCGFGTADTEASGDNGNSLSTPSDCSCGLLCASGPSLAPEIIPSLGNCGPGGVARSMLIRIAMSVPPELRRRGDGPGKSVSPLTKDGFMWEEDNFQNWRYLVERGRDVGSFLQAFVVLVYSIDTSKLPRWWTGAREGWSSAIATMASKPYGFSSVIVRLHALDAAIFDYMRVSSVPPHVLQDNAPPVLRGLGNKERMEKVLEWANRIGYKRFLGDNDGACFEGGELICCEFCQKSQHSQCSVPPVSNSSELKIWACPMCINDIAVVAGEADIS